MNLRHTHSHWTTVIFMGVWIALMLLYGSIAKAATGVAIKADLLILLGQTQAQASRSWSDAQLYSILNMAAHEVAPRGGGYEKIDTLAGGSVRPAGTNTDFIALKGTAWLFRNGKEHRTIPYKPIDSFHVLIAANDPQVAGRDKHIISEDGGAIVIFPALASSDSLLVSYSAYIATIDSASEVGFTLGWEQALIYAAASIAYQKLDDRFWAGFYIVERDKLIAALSALVSRRPAPSGVR